LDFLHGAKGDQMPSSGKPSIRFFHSASLRARTNGVLAAIARDEDPTQHAGALSRVVLDLTNAGLDYYFLRPLKQAKVGFVAQQTARLGMAGTLRMMSPVIHRILAGANATQMRVIARHISHLM
jgi:hypothetical protein